MRSRLAVIGFVASFATIALPAHALEGDFHTHGGDDYAELVDAAWAELPNLSAPLAPGVITGSDSVDDRIWEIAFERGYVMTPHAEPTLLIRQDGVRMQAAAAEAWERLQAAARESGHRIEVTSGYRSVTDQRSVFLSRLYGTSTSAIDSRLAYAAPPGASRHHTGHTLDIKQTGGTINTFRTSRAYAWLSADNFFNAKRFGFIPSYPEDGPPQGPVPEAWEYVYVGLDRLVGDLRFIDVPRTHFAFGAVEWMASNGHTHGCGPYFYCVEAPTTRGEAAAFIRRVLHPSLGPAETKAFVDTTGHLFEADIAWLAGHGITRGCDPPVFSRFCPDRSLSRGEMAALLERAVADLVEVDRVEADRFTDTVESTFVSEIDWLAAAGITSGCNPPDNTRFCPDAQVTRAELAVFLRRIADRL